MGGEESKEDEGLRGRYSRSPDDHDDSSGAPTPTFPRAMSNTESKQTNDTSEATRTTGQQAQYPPNYYHQPQTAPGDFLTNTARAGSGEKNEQYTLAIVPVDGAKGQQPRGSKSVVPPEREDSDDTNIFNEVFSTRRPPHVVAGVASGLKSVGKGVLLGVTGLVAAPVHGAYTGGAGGFLKGLAVGVTAAAVLPVAGVGVAAVQIVRGAANTGEALQETQAGKKYDKESGVWKVPSYSLQDEYEKIQAESVVREQEKAERKEEAARRQRGLTRGGSTDVADTTYYDLLGVQPNATAEEIRREYYKLARQCHPDKHPDDPQANQKFQKLGEAYQVLADADRRRQYDLEGKDAVGQMDLIDSSLFFTMLFGSDSLEPYVGKLKMAQMAEDMEEETMEVDPVLKELRDYDQRKREVELAILLLDRITPALSGDPEVVAAWEAEMTLHAKEMCAQSFGAPIVEAVGWGYENYATQFLGKLESFLGISGRYAKFQNQTRKIGIVYRAAKTGIRAARQAQDIDKKSKQRTKKQSEEKGAIKSTSFLKRHHHHHHRHRRKATADDTNPESPMNGMKSSPGVSSSSGDEFYEGQSPKSDGSIFNAESVPPSARYTSGTSPTSGADGGSETGPKRTASEEKGDAKAAEEAAKAAEEAKQLEETLPLVIQTMLQICLLDIQETVRSAAKKVLKDTDVDIETRKARAHALLTLGKVFQQEASNYDEEHKDDKPPDLKHQMEEAYIRTIQKADEMSSHPRQ